MNSTMTAGGFGNTAGMNERTIWERIIATDGNMASTVLRIALALVIFPHGAQKLLGWFGGYGFEGTMGHFTETMGIPYIFALLAIIAEFFGPLALLAGFMSRVAAFGITVVMVVAMLMHVGNGFFMNWSGAQAGEGFEYHLLAIAMGAVLIVLGGGAWSVDRRLGR